MDWYYAAGNERKGPISEDDLRRLTETGVVTGKTLVWREGMVDWKPYREAASAWPSPATRGNVEYGGFWIRFVAYCLDAAILGVVQSVLFVGMFGGTILSVLREVLTQHAAPEMPIGQVLPMAISARLIALILTLGYFAWFWTQYGATPGKMALGLKVVNPDGGPITLGQAIGRYLGTLLSGMILGIGSLMASFDVEKRALHDRLATTRVVRTRR